MSNKKTSVVIQMTVDFVYDFYGIDLDPNAPKPKPCEGCSELCSDCDSTWEAARFLTESNCCKDNFINEIRDHFYGDNHNCLCHMGNAKVKLVRFATATDVEKWNNKRPWSADTGRGPNEST